MDRQARNAINQAMTKHPEQTPGPALTREDGTRHIIGDQPVTIGRDASCEIVLVDDGASRCHARVRPVACGYEVMDLGSMNGTLVNGLPVEAQHLYHGDTLVIGATRFLAEGFPDRPAEVAIENAHLVQRLAEEKAALHEAHEELKAAHEALVKSEKLAVVGLLSSGIIHDLKNPISAIHLCNEMLAGHLRPAPGGGVSLEAIAELSENIAVGVAQCRQVMHRLLMYTGDRQATRTECCPRALVEEMVEFLNYEILRSGAEVSCTFADDLTPVCLVPNDIKQALINVTLNALQAMKPGNGRLEIEVDAVEDQGAPRVRIRFRDNGRGMSADECKRVFEPFYRGTDRPGQSVRTGLGMSVSQGIIKQHHGLIRVDSVEGQGTTVDVLLPAGATAEHHGAEALGVTQRIPLPI